VALGDDVGVVSALLPLPLPEGVEEAEDEGLPLNPTPMAVATETTSVSEETEGRRLDEGLVRGLAMGLVVGLGAA
jgi:hypothetical protein